LECVCSDESAKARLAQATAHPAGNRDFELYMAVKHRFETITLPKTVLDTDIAIEVCVLSALTALKS
jgi:uncharacterized protein (DUF362 family)